MAAGKNFSAVEFDQWQIVGVRLEQLYGVAGKTHTITGMVHYLSTNTRSTLFSASIALANVTTTVDIVAFLPDAGAIIDGFIGDVVHLRVVKDDAASGVAPQTLDSLLFGLSVKWKPILNGA